MSRVAQYNVERTDRSVNGGSIVFKVTDPSLPGKEGLAQIDPSNGNVLGTGFSDNSAVANLHLIALLHAIEEAS